MVRVIKSKSGKLYDCFVYELSHNRNTYVLFDGRWFVVDQTFHATVEADFAKLVSKKPFVASTKMGSEREFIAELEVHNDLLNS